MSFEVSCSHCDGRLLVETPGVVVACPHCNTHLSIPAEIPGVTATPPAPEPAPVQQPVVETPIITEPAPPSTARAGNAHHHGTRACSTTRGGDAHHHGTRAPSTTRADNSSTTRGGNSGLSEPARRGWPHGIPRLFPNDGFRTASRGRSHKRAH